MRVLDIFSKREQLVPESVVDEVESPATPSQPNPTDKVTVDVPLLLRIMEYAKEDARTDMDLHHVAEKLVQLSANGQTLSMANYKDIVNSVSEGDSPAEKLIKDIEYNPDSDESKTYHVRKTVATTAQGMPVVRYEIVDNDGNRQGPSYDSAEAAKSQLRKFDQGDVTEGYGRYWCSTDKRWKERKGPKQSRG